jgi:hypothetical protein
VNEQELCGQATFTSGDSAPDFVDRRMTYVPTEDPPLEDGAPQLSETPPRRALVALSDWGAELGPTGRALIWFEGIESPAWLMARTVK